MTIIDPSYFTGKINLPQTGNTAGNERVQQFIDRYEPEFLKQALGYSLWKAFTGGIEGSGTIDQKWLNLLYGAEFTIGTRVHRWNGFAQEGSGIVIAPETPIAQYVYYQFLRDIASSITLVGNAASKTDNAERVNSLSKMCDAWNDMVDMTQLLAAFLTVNATDYPDFQGVDTGVIGWAWYYGCDVYREGVFKKINEFGI